MFGHWAVDLAGLLMGAVSLSGLPSAPLQLSILQQNDEETPARREAEEFFQFWGGSMLLWLGLGAWLVPGFFRRLLEQFAAG